MTSLWRNVQFGLRLLRKNPGFAVVAILALALGIGANTAIFSVLYGALLAHLPYRDPERLVSVWSRHEGNRMYVSPADYLDWKRENTVFEGLGALQFDRVAVSVSSGPPEVLRITRCTPSLVDALGIPFVLGRGFLPEEGTPGKDHVTVLGYAFWKEHFGEDRSALGQKIRIDGEPYTVVGVWKPPATERMRENDHLTVPLSFKPEDISERERHGLLVQGRLKPGVTLAQANAEVEAIGRQIAQANPATNKGWDVFVERREHEWVAPELRSKLFLLMGAVGFVLLIACANVANLLLARGTVRQREIAIRTSLGATRRQLMAQFLTESMLLATLGAALGVALAWGLMKVIMALMPPGQFPTEAVVELQPQVLLFTLAISTIAAIVCGSAPVFQSLRVDPNQTLKDGTQSAVGLGGRGLRRLLVVGEFALALTLLTAAGLAMRGFWKAATVDFGFRTGHILTFSLQRGQGNQDRLKGPDQINAFYRQLLAGIGATPGVVSAQASMVAPAMGAAFRLPVTVAGAPLGDSSSQRESLYGPVTPGFFDTFGIQIVQGGPLTEFDREGSSRVAVVNETFVKRFLPGVNPLGQRVLVPEVTPGVRKPGLPVEWAIVGVYRDVRNNGLKEPEPEIDVPFWQNPWPDPLLAVRTAGDPEAVRKSIAGLIQSMDADLPMVGVQTIDDVVREYSADERFGSVLFGSFGAVGLVLAAFGIYGVMSFAVAQRTREIGLRIALGAGRDQVLRMFMSEGVALGLIGLAIGIGGTYGVGRLMKGMWYGTGEVDLVAFGSVAIVLLLSALLACYIPARRAANVDPMVALRYE